MKTLSRMGAGFVGLMVALFCNNIIGAIKHQANNPPMFIAFAIVLVALSYLFSWVVSVLQNWLDTEIYHR